MWRAVTMAAMDIKIGLADISRELTIRLPEGGEAVVAKIQSAIEAGTPTITVEDEKGRSYLIRTDRIAYVERGSAATHTVGFMR